MAERIVLVPSLSSCSAVQYLCHKLHGAISEQSLCTPCSALQFLCLAFYQKEMALYVRKQLDAPILSFCLDADMSPEFKASRLGVSV